MNADARFNPRGSTDSVNPLLTCVWFDHGQALKAAHFYASVFPDSSLDRIKEAAVIDTKGMQNEDKP